MNETTVVTLRHFEVGIKGTEYTREVSAETAGSAKYRYLLDVRDVWPEVGFQNLTCRKIKQPKPTIEELAENEAEAWSVANPVGTIVDYWTFERRGEPSGRGAVKHKATLVCANAVAWISGCSSCVSLSHVEAVREP